MTDTPATAEDVAPEPAPAAPVLDPIQASLREQAATVQQGAPHRRIHRREVQPDGKPKSNPVTRRRAEREKE